MTQLSMLDATLALPLRGAPWSGDSRMVHASIVVKPVFAWSTGFAIMAMLATACGGDDTAVTPDAMGGAQAQGERGYGRQGGNDGGLRDGSAGHPLAMQAAVVASALGLRDGGAAGTSGSAGAGGVAEPPVRAVRRRLVLIGAPDVSGGDAGVEERAVPAGAPMAVSTRAPMACRR